MKEWKKRLPWIIGGLIWLTAIGIGFGIAWRIASTPGVETNAPQTWPASTRLKRVTDRYTLVMFVHTYCPCSRASLAELGKLMPKLRGRAAAVVVFVRPEGTTPESVEASLRDRAAGILDTIVMDDESGEAKRFNAETSGAVLLYDATGRLAFTGGLTSERGHEGESMGQRRIINIVMTGAADRADGPVFGCELEDSAQQKEKP